MIILPSESMPIEPDHASGLWPVDFSCADFGMTDQPRRGGTCSARCPSFNDPRKPERGPTHIDPLSSLL